MRKRTPETSSLSSVFEGHSAWNAVRSHLVVLDVILVVHTPVGLLCTHPTSMLHAHDSWLERCLLLWVLASSARSFKFIVEVAILATHVNQSLPWNGGVALGAQAMEVALVVCRDPLQLAGGCIDHLQELVPFCILQEDSEKLCNSAHVFGFFSMYLQHDCQHWVYNAMQMAKGHGHGMVLSGHLVTLTHDQATKTKAAQPYRPRCMPEARVKREKAITKSMPENSRTHDDRDAGVCPSAS